MHAARKCGGVEEPRNRRRRQQELYYTYHAPTRTVYRYTQCSLLNCPQHTSPRLAPSRKIAACACSCAQVIALSLSLSLSLSLGSFSSRGPSVLVPPLLLSIYLCLSVARSLRACACAGENCNFGRSALSSSSLLLQAQP